MLMDYTKPLTRSHFMRKYNSPKQTPQEKEEEEINFDLPSPLRVKADEKLELLTGMDDSPTLQATAPSWAPSEAALALAAAHANQIEKSVDASNSKSSDDISESEIHAIDPISLINHSNYDDDEGSQSLRYGLGFDPTKNMDSVITSPDFMSTDNNRSQTISVPDLVFNVDNPVSTRSKNPFATDTLLGPSPWGGNVPTVESMGSLSNWDYL